MAAQRKGKIADAVYAVALLVVAGVVWWEASALAPAPFDPLGPKTFPLWIAGGLALLALIMLARMALGGELGRARQSMVFGLGDDDGAAAHGRRPFVALALFALSVAYAASLSLRGLGFLATTALYVFCAGMLLSEFRRSRILPLAVIAVAMAFASDFVFRRIFGLDLP